MSELLTPKDVAEAIGVSESSMKRWADAGRLEATRTAGGHRRIPIWEAVRFVRENGFEVVRPDRLGLQDVSRIAEASGAGRREDLLYRALAEGRAAEGRGLIVSMYLDNMSVAEICDGPVRSAMERLGELWQHNDDGVFIEHRATDICLSALNALRTLIPTRENAPIAVGGVPSGDPYLLPSIAACTVLASEGFDAVNLGPETPVETFMSAVEHYKPALVWVSATAVDNARQSTSAVKELATRLSGSGCALVVGGRIWQDPKFHPPRDVQFAGSMAELAAFARGLLATHSPAGVSR